MSPLAKHILVGQYTNTQLFYIAQFYPDSRFPMIPRRLGSEYLGNYFKSDLLWEASNAESALSNRCLQEKRIESTLGEKTKIGRITFRMNSALGQLTDIESASMPMLHLSRVTEWQDDKELICCSPVESLIFSSDGQSTL